MKKFLVFVMLLIFSCAVCSSCAYIDLPWIGEDPSLSKPSDDVEDPPKDLPEAPPEDLPDPPEPSEIDPCLRFLNGFSALPNAVSIHSELTLKSGDLTVYSLQKEYQKSLHEFIVLIEERTLNALGADEMVEVSSYEERVQAEEEFRTLLSLSASDFSAPPAVTDERLEGTLKESAAKRIFSLSEQEDLKNFEISIVLQDDSLSEMQFCFQTGEYQAAVFLSARY